MRNRISNAIAEYDKKFSNSKEGQFDAGDLYDIGQTVEFKGDYTDWTIKGLKAGFIIGYRKGLRDAARQQANKKGVNA